MGIHLASWPTSSSCLHRHVGCRQLLPGPPRNQSGSFWKHSQLYREQARAAGAPCRVKVGGVCRGMQEDLSLLRKQPLELKKIDIVTRGHRHASRLGAAVQPSSSHGEPDLEEERPESQEAQGAEEEEKPSENGEPKIDKKRLMPPPMKTPEGSLLCVSITATKVADALKEIRDPIPLKVIFTRAVQEEGQVAALEGVEQVELRTGYLPDFEVTDWESAGGRAGGAELVELRMDYLKDFKVTEPGEQLYELFKQCNANEVVPIVTMRPHWEGGKYKGDEAKRLAFLKYAALAGAPFIDVEFFSSKTFFAHEEPVPISTKIILSHHNFDDTPHLAKLQELRDLMFEGGADIVKIATTAHDVSDAMRALLLNRGSPGPVIPLAMGEKGVASRLLAPRYGSFLTFASLLPGRESAPGQLSLREMRQLYRVHLLNRHTQVMGVVGNPISHSMSPLIHNAALDEENLNAVYVPMLVDQLDYFLHTFRDNGYRGWSVTIPFKVQAAEEADELDPLAEKIGAVNTLVRLPDGGLKGYNTDCQAAIAAIEAGLRRGAASGGTASEGTASNGAASEGTDSNGAASGGAVAEGTESPLRGLRVVVLGAGGAGRALAFGAADKGAHVIIANRTLKTAQELAEAVGGGAEAVSQDSVEKGRVRGDVFVNTTSLGMKPKVYITPLPRAALKGYRLVFDAVYNPLETRLLKEAKEEGCAVVSGVEMFIGQAEEQYRLFTQREPPAGLMRKAVMMGLAREQLGVK